MQNQMDVLSVVPSELPPSVGERNSSARLTTRQVLAIREAHEAGGSVRGLAEAFGVSDRAIRHVVRGTSWTHVR
jgi:predicted DNA binding protein